MKFLEFLGIYRDKNCEDLCNENYKMLLSDIKDRCKWRNMPCSLTRKQH